MRFWADQDDRSLVCCGGVRNSSVGGERIESEVRLVGKNRTINLMCIVANLDLFYFKPIITAHPPVVIHHLLHSHRHRSSPSQNTPS